MILKDNGLNIQRRQTVAEIRNTKKTPGTLKKGTVWPQTQILNRMNGCLFLEGNKSEQEAAVRRWNFTTCEFLLIITHYSHED